MTNLNKVPVILFVSVLMFSALFVPWMNVSAHPEGESVEEVLKKILVDTAKELGWPTDRIRVMGRETPPEFMGVLFGILVRTREAATRTTSDTICVGGPFDSADDAREWFEDGRMGALEWVSFLETDLEYQGYMEDTSFHGYPAFYTETSVRFLEGLVHPDFYCGYVWVCGKYVFTIHQGITEIHKGNGLKDVYVHSWAEALWKNVQAYGLPEELADKVHITSLEPPAGSILTPDQQVAFAATISYTLGSEATGTVELQICDQSDNLIDSISTIVGKGSGSAPLIVVCTIPEDATSVKVYAKLFPGDATTPSIYDVKGLVVALPPIIVWTDKTTYIQGEAVNINCEVNFDGKPFPGAELTFEVLIPTGDILGFGIDIRAKTDESGRYSIMPLAGVSLGEYCVYAYTELEGRLVQGKTLFNVIKPPAGYPSFEQWKSIFDLYETNIPTGPILLKIQSGEVRKIAPGPANNAYYKADPPPGYDVPFHCSGYKDIVLAFLDGLRFSKSSEKRSLLIGIEYGPIMRGYASGRLITGEHHAVVIYKTSKEWKDHVDSTVLDPWLYQTPYESMFSVQDFKQFYSMEIIPYVRWRVMGDPEYRDKELTGYPTNDAPIYLNFEALGIARPTFPRWIDQIMTIGSPVDVLVTDSEGRRIGLLPNGTMVAEIPNTELYVYPLEDGTLGWYISLPEGEFYTAVTGNAEGTFNLVTSSSCIGEVQDYSEQPISKGEKSYITLNSEREGASLTMQDGTIVLPKLRRISFATITDHTLCLDIDVEGKPLQPTSTFKLSDSNIVSWVEIANVTEGGVFKWVFQGPNNYTHTAYHNFSSNKETYTCYTFIPIAGEQPSNLPGSWFIDAFINDKKVFTEDFEIKRMMTGTGTFVILTIALTVGFLMLKSINFNKNKKI